VFDGAAAVGLPPPASFERVEPIKEPTPWDGRETVVRRAPQSVLVEQLEGPAAGGRCSPQHRWSRCWKRRPLAEGSVGGWPYGDHFPAWSSRQSGGTMCRVPSTLEEASMSKATVAAVEVEDFTPQQARARLEERAVREFDMTLDEFADAFERGYFSTEGENTAAEELAFLLPLAR
jgi:hypothetical protein